MKNPVIECVERQVATYNNHQTEECVACFAEDAILERDIEGTKVVGRAGLREFYAELFRKFPRLRATVLHRTVVGAHVVDEELIEGREEGPFRTVMVYRVEEGLIRHARGLSREPVTTAVARGE